MADMAAAWRRVERVLQRSPGTGVSTDSTATVRWIGGTKVLSTHANGTEILTDMPTELGGDGASVTPGWLLRAALASCATTTIAMVAAAEGIELKSVEVIATSRSDARGLFGMPDGQGKRISAAPFDMQLSVRISAADATSPERLRELVEKCHRCSPVSCAVQEPVPVELRIECEKT